MSAHRQLIEDRFDVIEELADDGWESVFLARHREMGDECLVKVLRRPGDGDLAIRLGERLRWLTRLSHPRLAQLYDVRPAGPSHVVVEMEFVPGTSLDTLVADAVSRDEEAPLPIGTVFEVLDACLEAVDWLHDQGWHHGALAPSKFRLRRDDDGEMDVRLVDPGIGRLLGTGERTTAGSLLARRLRYAAPERFLGDLPEPSVAVDVYALGLVAYELFTGRYPIVGESATALAAGHLMHPPLSFSESDPGGRLSEELRSLIREALAKEPERRPESVNDLRRRLGAAAEVEARKGAEESDVLALLLEESRGGAAVSGGPSAVAEGPQDVRPAGPSFETYDMRAARDEAKRREGKKKVRRLVKDAGDEVNRSNYTAALDLLRDGLRYAPEEPKLVELLRQVESAARRRKADAQRRRKIDEEVRAVEALLEKGEEEAARERLLDIEERRGTDPRLAALLRTLEPEEEPPADSTEARRRAEHLVSKARRLSRTEDFSGARKALREAVELDPEHSEARTLSESVEALVELGKQEGLRRRDAEEAQEEIRELLQRGEPGPAMARLNRAVARYGDLPELQKLRYDVARLFLEEDAAYEAGDATHVPRSARPEPAKSAGVPSSRPAAAGGPPPASPQAPSSRAAAAPPAPAASPKNVFELELAGLGGDGPPPPGTDWVPEPKPVPETNPWFDLRDPRGLILLILLLALVAFLGHWAATRGQGDAAPVDVPPAIETEDV
ncbi:MAG: protein kinase [Thermoanaerobaculia bacterium]|nr:protein kinase [Thermoanaerobaculia bacterium]